MNIHPLFVHFPIGLLIAYSLLEVVSAFCTKLRTQSWVAATKGFLLSTGVLTAFVALATGGMAEDLIQGVNPRAYILEVHAPLAGATTLVYLIILAGYLVRWFDVRGWGDRIVGDNHLLRVMWNFKKRFWSALTDTWALPVLALLGLILLTLTGGLGAAMVYGPNIDPVVSFIYHLFWVQ